MQTMVDQARGAKSQTPENDTRYLLQQYCHELSHKDDNGVLAQEVIDEEDQVAEFLASVGKEAPIFSSTKDPIMNQIW